MSVNVTHVALTYGASIVQNGFYDHRHVQRAAMWLLSERWGEPRSRLIYFPVGFVTASDRSHMTHDPLFIQTIDQSTFIYQCIDNTMYEKEEKNTWVKEKKIYKCNYMIKDESMNIKRGEKCFMLKPLKVWVVVMWCNCWRAAAAAGVLVKASLELKCRWTFASRGSR